MSHFKPQMRRLFLSLTTATLLLNLSIAEAVPFSTNLQVNGSSTFNDGWSQGFNGAEGSFGIVSDGTSTDSAFAIDSTVTGDNPVSGAQIGRAHV